MQLLRQRLNTNITKARNQDEKETKTMAHCRKRAECLPEKYSFRV